MRAVKTLLDAYASYYNIKDYHPCGLVTIMQQHCTNDKAFEKFKIMAFGWFLNYFTTMGYNDKKRQTEINRRLLCLEQLHHLDMADKQVSQTVFNIFQPYNIYQCPNSLWTLLLHTQETDDKIICPCGISNPCNPYEECAVGSADNARVCHHVRYLELLTIDQALDKITKFNASIY